MKIRLIPHLTSLVTICICWCGLASASAQEVQIETQHQANERDPYSRNNQSSFSLSDPGLGEIDIVSRQERPKMFTLFTTQSFNFTTNAFLARDNEQSDFFYNGRLGISYVPYSTRDLTPRITFVQNFFRFSDNRTLDFDSQTLNFELKYNLNASNATFVNLSYGLSRLESPDSNVGEFYKYGLLNASLSHVMPLGNSRVSLAVTGGGYWRAGDPSASDRVVFYGQAVAIYDPLEKVQVTAFARPEFQFYTNDPTDDHRKDLNIIVGASATWTPIQYVSLSATASYTANFSSVGFHSYEVAVPSIVLGAQFSF